MKIFTLSKIYSIVCETKKTRNGFKHTAKLCRNGNSIYETKICYLNRTWERFEYDSVLEKIINMYFKDREKKKYLKVIKQREDIDNSPLKTAGLVALLGDVMCKTREEKIKWKKRMLSTISGIDIPKDFDILPEEEKERRLNGAIKISQEKIKKENK